MAGFKDFFQYASATRVVAGPRPAGQHRVRVEQGGRAPRLAGDRPGDPGNRPDRPRGGRRGRRRSRGGRRVRRRAPGLVHRRRRALRRGGARGRRRRVPGRGRRLGARHREDRRLGLQPGRQRGREGGLLPDGPGRRRHGRTPADRPAGLHPHHRRHGLRGLDGRHRQGPRAQGEARDRRLPAVPAPGHPRPRGDQDAAAEDRRGHRHGRDDTRDRELRGAGVEPVSGGPLAGRAAADPGEPGARRQRRPQRRGGAGQHAGGSVDGHRHRAGLHARDVPSLRRPVRRAPRRGERDQPPARHPLQRRGRRRRGRPLPRRLRRARGGERRLGGERWATTSPPT